MVLSIFLFAYSLFEYLFCEVSKYPKSMRSQRVGHNWATELNWYSMYWLPKNLKIVHIFLIKAVLGFL